MLAQRVHLILAMRESLARARTRSRSPLRFSPDMCVDPLAHEPFETRPQNHNMSMGYGFNAVAAWKPRVYAEE